ncbi:TPA: cell surface protein, partial [Enterococcus faecalis]|nr:cell surface protein [Enterococcus faecalis]HDT8188140.1 cell surface protein [Enterococcus faecalis]
MKKFTVITLFSTLLLVGGTGVTAFADETIPTADTETPVDPTNP